MAGTTPKLSTLKAERSAPSSNVVLSAASPRSQILDPTTNIDVVLPSVSSIFDIVNTSVNNITVKASNGDIIITIGTGKVSVFPLSTTPTTGADWLLETLSNTNIAANAAIAGTKIDPNFGSQNIDTTGNISTTTGTVSGNELTGTVIRSFTGTSSLNAGANEAIFNAVESGQYLAVATFTSGTNSSSQAIALISRRSGGTAVLINYITANNGLEWIVGSAASARMDVRNNNGGATSYAYSVLRLR